jgi:3'(2'), 5'-bisphosphate nucleotidase
VWIIDPLDGTREFGEGRDDWAVHVALAIDGAPLVGAVALPARGIVLASDAPPALPAPATPPRMLVSRSRPSQLCANVRDAIGAETIGMGSAGAKAMAVVLGEAEIYLHSGGQHQWDNCAPAAVALAAGLHASRIDGSPLVYNARSTSVPDLLICRKEWADRVLAAVGNCGG